ncbi:PqqA binding protein [Halomonadaceae bacterium LMG 33818]|uniref:pyrroloquinoline quinone biosynthesis peptide chaperone PqqD n=1 Tax=Cernens ardua TaxID=3402176 RepID=UPI003EDC0C1E
MPTETPLHDATPLDSTPLDSTFPDAADEHRIPRLVRGVRMREDAVRGGWVLLAPEKVFKLDQSGREIMSLVNGERSVAEIIDTLVERFDADRAVIATDVAQYFSGLSVRQVIEFS